MDQTRLPSISADRSNALTLRGRIVRAGLVSALCAVLGAGFIAGPHAGTHATLTSSASHVVAQAISTDATIGGPGNM